MAAEPRVALPRVDVPGGAVEYLDVPGATDRSPLLFLHEGLGSVGLWRGFPANIAAATGRRVVAYSRLGHGWSDPPPAKRGPRFMHDEAATVVPALCTALGLRRPIVVGHSDGASIALLVAATVDVDVAGLVVLAPHVFVEPVGLRGIEATRRTFVESDMRRRMARHHRDPEITFWSWNEVWLSEQFRDWDLRPDLGRIRCPVLGVQGTADPYGTLAHVEAIRHAAQGRVRLLVLDCAHSPHLEAPEATHDALVEFIEELP